jgi:hypothetical protein
MADLLTNGTATKPPGQLLPKEHPAMQVIALNEFTMPGDALGVSPRHPPVSHPPKERMAQIIRERSLDIVHLMDDFLKRPAYSRMPTRNRAFLDVQTFRRALCYAMGDQWTRLAMTSAEFKDLCNEFVRPDNTFYDKDKGVDVQGFGQPEPLVLWLPFAYEVQKLADGDKYTLKLRGAMNAEQQALYDKSVADAKAAEEEYAAHAGLDIGKAGTGHLTSNTAEAMERLRMSQLEQKRAEARPVGVRGATVGQVNAAKKLICDRLIQKNATIRKALKDIDESGDGVLSRDEVKKFLKDQNLLKYFDFLTGTTRGDLDPKVVETLLDMVDENEDGVIKYDEFSR